MVRSWNSPLVMLIKPPEENSTPATLNAFQVSLVEPVAYPFKLTKSSEKGFSWGKIGS
jgi:hypothetical protein